MLRPALAAAVLIALSSCSFDVAGSDARPAPTVTLRQSDEAPPASDLADVVAEVLPSVVNVRVQALQPDFFGGFQEGEQQGSGVVIDRAGIIVTNNHVIANATEVTVVFNDDVHHDPLEGEVIGRVAEKDLAVVRVNADDLVPIELGRSESLRLGDSVLAVGFPLGLGGPTVTQGIISGLRRTIRAEGEPGALEDLLQTDAAINPGNSGGALVDLNGRLVGINTAAASAGFAENIGFAIAVDQALPVVRQILTEDPSERAWLGVYIQPVDSDSVAARLGLDPDVRGALIVSRIPGGPAERFGLREGEVISRVGPTDIDSSDGLTEALADFDPGDEVEIELVSERGRRVVEVELARRPEALD